MVSDAVSDLRCRKGLKNQGKMVLPFGIEPGFGRTLGIDVTIRNAVPDSFV
jgi:hypothetical protein